MSPLINDKPRLPLKDILLFGVLPGFVKKLLYRLKGYQIGQDVSIGFGSVIIGKEVAIGNNTSFGFFSIVRGKKIVIGNYVSIGSTSFLDTPYIEIGDGTKINEQVFVGGLQFPDSKFVVGRNCQIMQMSFINPAKSVTIGDDSGIGGHCLIFGHTSWLSFFEGYPVDFQPIHIGNSVSIAWGAFVLPGSQIGDGAVIGARSVVTRVIPPRCLAVGFPARVVSKYPDFPVEVTDAQKIDHLKRIVNEMVAFFQGSGLPCSLNGDILHAMSVQKMWFGERRRDWKLSVSYEKKREIDGLPSGMNVDVWLSLWEIPAHFRDHLDSKRIMWIDIERKEQSEYTNDLGEEVVLFLRRYGVRFFRVSECERASIGVQSEVPCALKE